MPLPSQRQPQDEAMLREMERISLDWCMIYNPTDEDFVIEYRQGSENAMYTHLVPNQHKDIGWGEGKREVQRYLARWYCQHMKDKIVNQKGQAVYEKWLKERSEKGQANLTPFEQQKAIWDKTPRTTDNKELASLYPILFLGVTKEFGIDYNPEGPRTVEQKTQEEMAMEAIQHKKYTAPIPVQAPQPSVDELEEIMPKRTTKKVPINKEEVEA